MAVKLADVAAACDVDISTASRAMRNDPRVHADTQQRIQAMAKKMGYLPNLLARSLAAGKTNTIAIIVHGLEPGTDNELFDAASKYLQEHDYIGMVMAHHGNMKTYERIVEQLGQGLVDGAIIIVASISNERAMVKKLQQRIPVVCLDRGIDKSKIPVVSSEQDVAVEHLIKQCKDRGVDNYIITFGDHNTSALDRSNAAKALLKGKHTIYGDPSDDFDFSNIKNSCALLVSSQWHATHLMQGYAEHMKDLTVFIGWFDKWHGDCFPAQEVFVAVQDFESMAQHAVALCQKLIAGEQADAKIDVQIKEFQHFRSQFT